MLNADYRNQIFSWRKQQFVSPAGLVSILAQNGPMPADQVEKSGTGIVQAKTGTAGCKAGLSLTMDSVERVVSRKHVVIQSFKFYYTEDLRSRKPSVH